MITKTVGEYSTHREIQDIFVKAVILFTNIKFINAYDAHGYTKNDNINAISPFL